MLFRRSSDHSRLEAFSDAVFAFALTLLVVALEVPQNYRDLMQLMGGFLSCACCFGRDAGRRRRVLEQRLAEPAVLDA